MSTKEPNEKRIRKKILSALKKRNNGSTAVLRQSEINQLVGKASVRAAYLKGLLKKMQEERLIDCHYWQTNTTRKRSCFYWAVFNHPENVKYRKRRKQAVKESEKSPVVRSIFEYGQRIQAESAARRAKEKFQKDLDSFFVHNHGEILDTLSRICRSHTQKTRWLHSRQWI